MVSNNCVRVLFFFFYFGIKSEIVLIKYWHWIDNLNFTCATQVRLFAYARKISKPASYVLKIKLILVISKTVMLQKI